MKKRWSKKTKKTKGKKAQSKKISLDQIEALQAITEKGAKLWSRMNKRDVKEAVHLGQFLSHEKELILVKYGKSKGAWGKYREEHYPGLEAKTAQRYMQLAENVDLEEHPTLAYLGQAKLLKLIQLGDGKTPAEVLDAGEMDIVFDPKDADSQKQFQSEAAALIKQLVAEHRESKAEESSKEPGEEAAKVLKKFYELLKQPEELEGFRDLLEGDKDLRKKNRSVRIKLRNLPPKPIKIPGKALAKKKVKPKKVAATG